MTTKQIIIAAERWVFVGDISRDGDQVVISNCYNVRRWGTTEGLGHLALHGPQPDTVLDHYGTARLHVLGVVGSLECSPDAWAKHDKAHAKKKVVK